MSNFFEIDWALLEIKCVTLILIFSDCMSKKDFDELLECKLLT